MSVIEEIASLVGEPVVVDELSLVRAGPVRVQLRCRNLEKLKGFVEIFLMRWDMRSG